MTPLSSISAWANWWYWPSANGRSASPGSGRWKARRFTYEVTLLYWKYKDRIGLLLKADQAPLFRNKQVEQVPPVLLRTGTTLRRNAFSATLQYAYMGQQFTDATNAIRTATAVNAVIPAYHIADLSATWRCKWLTPEGSCNNVLNARYVTRRADSYPGSCIILTDARAFCRTVGARL